MVTKQVANILKKEGFLSKENLPSLKKYEQQNRGNVLDFCIDNSIASTDKIIPLLRKSHLIPVIDLVQIDIDRETAKLLPASVCFEHAVIPFYEDNGDLYVAMANPDDEELISYIKQKTGKNIVPYLTYKGAIRQTLQLIFNHSVKDSHDYILELIQRARKLSRTPETMAKEAPIISLLNHLITFSLRSKASDMHIEPHDNSVKVRIRVDGLLHEFFSMPKELLASLVARVKILSRLRIDEHLRPQDGRFSFTEDKYDVSIRVSIAPTLHGQKVALRFLDTNYEKLTLNSLGLGLQHFSILSKALSHSNGMVLVTGPTGSGKTTTLYALLKSIARNKINISTIEDPVEYHLKGANQIQVNQHVGLSFAQGLRSILRQDPDVIMVGEIRDKETATIAINAALTGHLVFSSLHTNSAVAAIPRLLDMGVEPYLIASTLRAVIGQRLARRICDACKSHYTIDKLPDGLVADSPGPLPVAKGAGCQKCLNTGYVGRVGVFEILHVDEYLHDSIINRVSTSTLESKAREQGFKSLQQDGLKKVLGKKTSINEVLRIIN